MAGKTVKPKTTPKSTVGSNSEKSSDIRLKEKLVWKGKDVHAALKRLFIVVIALLGLMTIAGLVVDRTGTNKNLAFTIGERDFTRSEVEAFLEYPVNVLKQTKSEAETRLIELLTKQVSADELNIRPSAVQVETAAKRLGFDTGTDNKWIKLLVGEAALAVYFDEQKNTEHRGYAFVFYFGNLLVPQPFDPEPANFGNASLIEQEKSYAKQQVEKYHSLVSQQSQSAETLLKEASADAKTNPYYKKGASLSRKFGYAPDVNWENEIGQPDIVSFLKSGQFSGQTSAIQTGKIAVKELPDGADDYKEAYYYFVHSEQEGLISQASFNEHKQSLKVTIYEN